MSMCELVKIRTEHKLRMSGAYFPAKTPRAAIVHVHGSCGNFYEAEFLGVLADAAVQSDISFLSFNLRAHDCIAEGYGDKDYFAYVGGSLQEFENCIIDIDAALKFVKRDVEALFLNGHSLGCERVVHFILNGRNSTNCVRGISLLSPCDSCLLQEAFIAPETIEHQRTRLREMGEISPWGLLEPGEYGIRHGEEEYSIPITRRALLSITEGPPFKLFNVKEPARFWLKIPTVGIIGGSDSFQMHSEHVMFQYLAERIEQFEPFFFPDANHDFEGHEVELARVVVEFVERVLEKEARRQSGV